MSFLAPMFLVGALAVALPVIFHLIRRTSREKITFSSLMFLLPTPPRVTKRSRLEHILLLLLRCAVLGLLALGFARPFFPDAVSDATPKGAGKRVVVLVDISASMRRGTLWTDARAKAEAAIRAAGPGDQLALFAFDRRVTRLVTFEQWDQTAAGDRVPMALQRLSDIKPGWSDTHLGDALVTAAETLEEINRAEKQAPGVRQIIAITDLQEGSRLDSVQAYVWPKGIVVDFPPLKTRRATNAGLQLLAEADDADRKSATAATRVRVSNASDAQREQFQVGWARADGGGFAAPGVDVYVPPGQSRVVPLPTPPSDIAADHIILRGDDEDFDNHVYVLATEPARANILYLGNDAEQDTTKPLYFIKRAFPSTHRQVVEVIARPVDGLLTAADTDNAPLIILADPPSLERGKTLRTLLMSGKTFLVPMQKPDAATGIAQLLELSGLAATEAPESGYAMWSMIDFQHPLFAPFADPRFSDFTKIHFWRHRQIDAAQIPGARVVARFDNGDPAFVEASVGKGRLIILTSGWQPKDSQLSVSSKFVPLLFSILEQAGGSAAQPAQFIVGDAVPLSNLVAGATSPLTIQKPDGVKVELPKGELTFSQADEPGIYSIVSIQPVKRFAVNLAAEESRTAARPVEEIEQLGVPMGHKEPDAARVAVEKRHQLNSDVENRQKLWRWLIVAALGVIMMETWLAGRLSRPGTEPMQTA